MKKQKFIISFLPFLIIFCLIIIIKYLNDMGSIELSLNQLLLLE